MNFTLQTDLNLSNCFCNQNKQAFPTSLNPSRLQIVEKLRNKYKVKEPES